MHVMTSLVCWQIRWSPFRVPATQTEYQRQLGQIKLHLAVSVDRFCSNSLLYKCLVLTWLPTREPTAKATLDLGASFV